WVKSAEILSFFKTAQRTNLEDFSSYQSFVEDYKEAIPELIVNLTLEQE
ncbi:MAG: hypothetical protein FJ044_04290, partial [Candidatus Cloacimonetes bacterium]|nr:hypothetical protein [Candidatus Cloacimonadota bacterium]